jgi:hypothetical protein
MNHTMHFILANLPIWIQTAAAVAIVGLTWWTILILRDYAADTKTIAKASLVQVENAQKPFLVLLPKPQEAGRHGGGWAIENQGFGPAINIRYSDPRGGLELRENVRALARDAYIIFDEFNIDAMRNHDFTAEYESLSGRRYRTVVTWPNGVMQTTVEECD